MKKQFFLLHLDRIERGNIFDERKKYKAPRASVRSWRTLMSPNGDMSRVVIFGRAVFFLLSLCERSQQNSTKLNKNREKLNKNEQNSRFTENPNAPPWNPNKKNPAWKKWTKFLPTNKISGLRDYNTYIRKPENTNFVRFLEALCEFCWNFVGQQNSNKILLFLEFYGVRGSSVLFMRLFCWPRKEKGVNLVSVRSFVQFCCFCAAFSSCFRTWRCPKFCSILFLSRCVLFAFLHVAVNKILFGFVVFSYCFTVFFWCCGEQNFVEFCCSALQIW